MNVILLSGGSGKRLWPLSNEIRSKQFIKIFRTENGSRESMLQRMYRYIRQTDSKAVITIATSKAQVPAIHNQLGNDVDISIEPCRKDTFPAIILAAAHLKEHCNISANESVVICPADPYVEIDFFEIMKTMAAESDKNADDLILMGISPTYPSQKYGYIVPISGEKVSGVSEYREKPDEKAAREYIARGALWNGGVFACRISYILKKAEELTGYSEYASLLEHYNELQKISFDYAVAEKEKNAEVIRFSGKWKDLGTWNTLTESMEDTVTGKGILNDSCSNVHIVNELDIPVLAMGLKDVVISASPQGILVSDKHESSYIKPIVDSLDEKVMFAEKSWGNFRVIDVEDGSMTMKVTLKAGSRMHYHSHQHRDEVWVVIAGTGRTILDGTEKDIRTGDVITMKAGCRHMVTAKTELQMIEVQIGPSISVEDKQKYDFPRML